MSDYLTINISEHLNIIKFTNPKINILNAKQIQDVIINLMTTSKNNLILDFTNVQFIDTTAFTTLHKIKIKAFTDNINLDYININDDLKELFNLIGFN